MAVIIDGTSGVTTPGVTNTAAETIATTLAVTGATTAASLQVGGVATNIYPLVSGTAVASTSGTSIDFTGIPSTAKRITVLFSGVSTTGTSSILVQLGSGSIQITGYLSTSVLANMTSSTNGVASTAGMAFYTSGATDVKSGALVLYSLSGNLWVSNHAAKILASANIFGGGDVTLSGALDRIRITTVNGTDTFDAGSVNIMWE
jgi:hypothetical protein